MLETFVEYVLVELKDADGNDVDRGVLIDGQSSGRTNSVLMVEQGHHEVRLDDPSGYSPAVLEVDVRNTMPNMPQVVSFGLIPA